MTGSAFVSLMYHLSCENPDELNLPVIVKNIKAAGFKFKNLIRKSFTNLNSNFSKDGTVQKVIFIEKALLSNNLSTREKNEKFFKKSLITTLVKPQIFNRSKDRQRQEKLNKMDTLRENLKENEESKNIELTGAHNMSVSSSLDVSQKSSVIEPKADDKEKLPIKRLRQSVSSDEEKFELTKKKIRSTYIDDATDSSNNNAKQNKKKKEKSPLNIESSDYEDYEDEDEKSQLRIVENKPETENFENPKSPSVEKIAIASPNHDIQPDDLSKINKVKFAFDIFNE